MGSDTLLVARTDSTPSWNVREGDRRIASGRPSIPAAWLALFDGASVRMAGSKPKFVALVTERLAGMARLAARLNRREDFSLLKLPKPAPAARGARPLPRRVADAR